MINFKNQEKKPVVFLMLSGGIDSAVAAVLLQKQGYDVRGFYFQGWAPLWLDCADPPEKAASCEMAEKFGIPWQTLDTAKLFYEAVFNPMFSGYFSGITPNPDTLCNREIKFGYFAEFALKNGADFIASGHYAKKSENPLRLLISRDPQKDQTYFLYDIKMKVLKRSLFPVGEYIKKDETRQLAKDFGLPERILNKRPTTDICFLLKGKNNKQPSLRDLLQKEGERRDIKFKPGKIIGPKGAEVGEHDGVMVYAATIGQRRGLKIGGSPKPYYVSGKDIIKNIIYVAYEPPKSSEIKVRHLNWLSGEEPVFPRKCSAKIRTPQKAQLCRSEKSGNDKLIVKFASPQNAVAPGQACVFYDGEIVLGGGIITN